MIKEFLSNMSGYLELAENIGLVALGAGIVLLLWWLLGAVRRHFKLVLAVSALIASLSFAWMVFF